MFARGLKTRSGRRKYLGLESGLNVRKKKRKTLLNRVMYFGEEDIRKVLFHADNFWGAIFKLDMLCLAF